jgi:transcriptional regulator with XRE-family HTH domain
MDGIADDGVDQAVGERVKVLRAERGLTLDDLSQRSGVSRAMISRIERGESSATAQLLNRLCNGLGVTLSSLFARDDRPASPLSRRAGQAVWRDPGSGYVRRRASPASTDGVLDLVDVMLPPGTNVTFDMPEFRGADQLVYVLEGRLAMVLGETPYDLGPGDCLHMRFETPHTFRNGTSEPARYLVALALGRRGQSR